jgi:hypothetical protein
MPIYRKGDEQHELQLKAFDDREAGIDSAFTPTGDAIGSSGAMRAVGVGPSTRAKVPAPGVVTGPVSGDHMTALEKLHTRNGGKNLLAKSKQRKVNKLSGKFTGEQIRSGALRKLAEENQ